MSGLYLRVLGGVDDISLSVHDPVYWDSRDDVRLDELKVVHKFGRRSWKLRLFQRRVKGLLQLCSLRN